MPKWGGGTGVVSKHLTFGLANVGRTSGWQGYVRSLPFPEDGRLGHFSHPAQFDPIDSRRYQSLSASRASWFGAKKRLARRCR